MKNMLVSLLLTVLVSPVLADELMPSVPLCALAPPDGWPVVNELRDLVHGDKALRETILKTIESKKAGNYWHGRGLDDLFTFFGCWKDFPPAPGDYQTYYLDFNALLYDGDQPEIDLVKEVNEGTLGEWLKKFMAARKKYLDTEVSTQAIPLWLIEKDIDISQYKMPKNGYQSFNEFFRRELKPGTRAIHSQGDPRAIVSPADCDLGQSSMQLASGDIPIELKSKGIKLNVKQMLNNNPLAEKFNNGTAIICALYVQNYHRFHSPVDGTVVAREIVSGPYFEDITNVELLTKNQRGYVIIETNSWGHVGVVPVGIATISSVNIEVDVDDVVYKGTEMGFFQYGGSVVIMLFEKDRYKPASLLKMGELIGTLQAADKPGQSIP